MPEADLPSFYRYIYRGAAYGTGHSDYTRWMQQAVRLLSGLTSLKVDGIFGSQTMQALNELGLAVNEMDTDQIYKTLSFMLGERFSLLGVELNALTISPSLRTQITAQRGGGLESVSLGQLYLGSKFGVRTIEVDDSSHLPEALEHAISNLKPQLIHVKSSFSASPTTGQVYLDFNADMGREGEWIHQGEAISSYVPLSATMLNDILLKLGSSDTRPLVIIEAQSPPGESAVALQMLLRNSFASELFQLGSTCCIVVTGLFKSAQDRQQMLTPLIDNLSKGIALGVAVNAANSVFNHRQAMSLQDPPTAALFTNDPLITLLPA